VGVVMNNQGGVPSSGWPATTVVSPVVLSSGAGVQGRFQLGNMGITGIPAVLVYVPVHCGW
jgi:hypothetical protein